MSTRSPQDMWIRSSECIHGIASLYGRYGRFPDKITMLLGKDRLTWQVNKCAQPLSCRAVFQRGREDKLIKKKKANWCTNTHNYMMLIFQNVLIFITNNSVTKTEILFPTVILAGTEEQGLVHGSPVEKMPLIWLATWASSRVRTEAGPNLSSVSTSHFGVCAVCWPAVCDSSWIMLAQNNHFQRKEAEGKGKGLLLKPW